MRKKNVLIIIVLLILLAGGFFIFKAVLNNLALDDSSAIIGGKLEKGYPYAGYLLGELPNNRLNICGGSFISPDIVLTAAHCVNNTIGIVVGLNEFTDNSYNVTKVAEFEINSEWQSNVTASSIDKSAGDIAVLKLSSPKTELNEFAIITEAEIGCNYEVVGYGETGEATPSYLNRERKSAGLCIEEIYGKVMLAKGSDGGLCFGDSGSPVFEKGTNRLVGIMSAAQMDSNGKCNIANLALVNSVWDFSEFINLFVNRNTPATAQTVLCAPADINGNNIFDIIDFSNISNYYQQQCKPSGVNYFCGDIDFDKDELISFNDVSIFSTKFGKNSCR